MNAYDTAQTAALGLLEKHLTVASARLLRALANLGSPDTVADAIEAVKAELHYAARINEDIAKDDILHYGG